MSEFTVFTPWSGDCFYISRFLSRVFFVICLQFKQTIRIWSFHLNLCFIIRKSDTGGQVWGDRGRIKESESFDKEAKVKKSRNVWWRSAETEVCALWASVGRIQKAMQVEVYHWCSRPGVCVKCSCSVTFLWRHSGIVTGGADGCKNGKNLTADSHKHREMKLKQTEVPNTPAETQNGSMKKMRHAETTKPGDGQTANHNDWEPNTKWRLQSCKTSEQDQKCNKKTSRDTRWRHPEPQQLQGDKVHTPNEHKNTTWDKKTQTCQRRKTEEQSSGGTNLTAGSETQRHTRNTGTCLRAQTHKTPRKPPKSTRPALSPVWVRS